MKYTFVEKKFEIDIKYDKYSDTSNFMTDRFFFAINSNNNKYVALNNCSYCMQGTNYNLTEYEAHAPGFIITSIWINNLPKMNECLIIGNRLYFLESLIYYKVKKIGILPVCVEKTYEEEFNKNFKKMKEKNYSDIFPSYFIKTDNFVIENKDTKNKYENIIYYNSAIIYHDNVLKNNAIFYDFIIYLKTAFKLLKKNGNFIFKLLNNNTNSLSVFNIQLIYILSSYFESVKYKKYDYANEHITIKDMVIFKKFIGNDKDVIGDILDKLEQNNKQIINLINVSYDEKYNSFIKKINKIIYNTPFKLYKLYDRKKNIKKYITQNTIDNIHDLKYTINIDNSIKLCQSAQLNVRYYYKEKSDKFKDNILQEILTDAKIVLYPYSHNYIYSKNHSNKQEYLSTLVEFDILSMYIKIRKKKIIEKIKKKLSIADFFNEQLFRSIIGFNPKPFNNLFYKTKFCNIFEIINNFKLINFKKNLSSVHIYENDTSVITAIYQYYRQYSDDDNFEWKILFANNTPDELKNNDNLLFKDNMFYDITNIENIEYIINKYNEIDICTFDCEKKNSTHILLCQIYISLKILRIRGNCIFKIYMSKLNKQIISLIRILSAHFEKIHISQSNINMTISDEIYITAINKKIDISEKIEKKILKLIKNYSIKKIIKIHNKKYDSLIYESLLYVINNQIKKIGVLLYYYDNYDEIYKNIELIEKRKYDYVEKWIKENELFNIDLKNKIVLYLDKIEYDDTTKTAIIVPYRDNKYQDRKLQLEQFIKHFHNYIKNLDIYIIEQSDDGNKFNRGCLLNCGYDIAKKKNYDMYIFHDVDLLSPNSIKNIYTYKSNKPIHIASLWTEKYNYVNFFGGITSFDSNTYKKINGYPNNFFGWGGEDDALLNRLKINKIKIYNLKSLDNIVINEIEHKNTKEIAELVNTQIKYNVNNDKTQWQNNGLSNLKYKIIKTTDTEYDNIKIYTVAI
jgi:hypothetical protein